MLDGCSEVFTGGTTETAGATDDGFCGCGGGGGRLEWMNGEEETGMEARGGDGGRAAGTVAGEEWTV
ncbi:hypothetical protein HanIR_Chr09g0401511 [Helianthus annuus]|nr:hypothetical protein HanIR_Chr09g0401511 [Helianthus annuus]